MGVYVTYSYDLYNRGEVTGGMRRFKELILSLAENGDTIHFFAPENARIPVHKNIIRHTLKKPGLGFIPAGLKGLVMNFRILKAARNINYDKFILVSVPYGIQGFLTGLQRISLILWEDFIACRKMQLEQKRIRVFNPVLIQALKAIETIALKKADQLIVQSRDDLEKITNRHRNKKEEIREKAFVMPNNVNASWIVQNKQVLKEKPLASPGNQTDIFFIGNVKDRRKGLHLLLDATEMLLDRAYKVRLHIIGGGRLMDNYKKKYSKREEIEFMGKVDNPVKLLKNADLLVVPSLVDSFPNTVMEGLFMEIPVIGAKSGGIPEMLVHEDLLFEPRVTDLYEKISRFIDEKQSEKLKTLVIQRKKDLTFDWGMEMSRILAR